MFQFRDAATVTNVQFRDAATVTNARQDLMWHFIINKIKNNKKI